jgi:protein-S-isoprenylcysteine O-methyltransferase Ste14
MATGQDEGAKALPIPPPLLYAVPLVLGLQLRKHTPGIPLPRLVRQLLGGLLLGGGGVLGGWFFRTMRHAHTTIDPRKPVAALVSEGPFRLSRNPGYLGLAAAYSGIALLANALVALLFLPAVMLVITRGVIRPEEQYLAHRFGEQYRTYQTRVRRWL